ncbi:MAG: 50S ribosomal protein L21 [Acidobacteriaceae bacterium]
MYAVIKAGGKQYRVAPGDVIRVEKLTSADGKVEISDVIAVSGNNGLENGSGAKVFASVVEEGRGDKIIVFKFKRKKQYKKTQGHRQAYTALKINEIQFNGDSFKAQA